MKDAQNGETDLPDAVGKADGDEDEIEESQSEMKINTVPEYDSSWITQLLSETFGD